MITQAQSRAQREPETKDHYMKSLANMCNPANVVDPFSDLEGELDRFFGNAWASIAKPKSGQWHPPIDVVDQDEAFIVSVDLPGMSKSAIQISVEQETLMIQGEREVRNVAEGTGTPQLERPVGKFARSVTLSSPVESERVKATYVDGVLVIELPKLEERGPRTIKVDVK